MWEAEEVPGGLCFFAHRRLPMGKKDKTLCALCASVVNQKFKGG